MLRIKPTWRSWLCHLSLRSLGGVTGMLLLLGSGAVRAQQGTIVIQRGPKPAASTAPTQAPLSAQPVAPASATLPEPFTPPSPGQVSAFPAPTPAVPPGLLNLVPPSSNAGALAANPMLVPPPMPIGWTTKAPAPPVQPMPPLAPRPVAGTEAPVTLPDLQKDYHPVVKAGVDPQPTLDLIAGRTRLPVPAAVPQRVPGGDKSLLSPSDLEFYLAAHQRRQGEVNHEAARLDPTQLKRLSHCEDLLIAGPQGYSNGRE